MTDEQINNAISKDIWFCHLAIRVALGFEVDHDESKIEIKNYVDDLNLMHKAEKTLNCDQWDDYIDELAGRYHDVCDATARLRAEAFLRTLGKWEDGK